MNSIKPQASNETKIYPPQNGNGTVADEDFRLVYFVYITVFDL